MRFGRGRDRQLAVGIGHLPLVGLRNKGFRHPGGLDVPDLGLAENESRDFGRLADQHVEIAAHGHRHDRTVAQFEIDIVVVVIDALEQRTDAAALGHGGNGIARGIENPLGGLAAVVADRPVALVIDRHHGLDAFARHAQFRAAGHQPLGFAVGRDRPIVDLVRILLDADNGCIGSGRAVLDLGRRVVRKIDDIAVGALFDLDDGHRIVHDFLEGRNLGVHLADLGFESLDPALQVVHILPQFRVVIVVATRQQGGGNKEQCAHAGGQSPHRKKSHSNLFKLNKSRVGYMTAPHQATADNNYIRIEITCRIGKPVQR